MIWETERLALTLDGHVAELTFTRPDRLNALDAQAHEDLAEALTRLRRLDGVRAAVIASSGKAFSAGGDFEFMRQAREDLGFVLRHGDDAMRLLTDLLTTPFPVVAAVQGPAIGLGATIALACDCVVAAKAAVLADPHVNIGLAAGDGGCIVWPAAVGMLRAKRYLLTGDRLPAEEAYRMGLVTDLVDEPDEVLPAARTLAARMAALPPLAVQGTKRALANVMRIRAAEVGELAFAMETRTTQTDDLLEAVAAFEERREGRYASR